MARKPLLWALAVLGVAAIVSSLLKVHYVQTDAYGDLFWNSREAYFAIGLRDKGYRLSYLGFGIEAARETLPFGASSPTDTHCSLLVVHVTASTVERHSIDNFCLSKATPLDGNLYVWDVLAGPLMKWTDDHFEPVSPAEQARVRDAVNKGEIPSNPTYENVGGWSKRVFGGDVIRASPNYVEKDAKVTLELDGNPLVFTMNDGFLNHDSYIDIEGPSRATQRIWELDEHSRHLSGSEYRAIFQKH